jgi:hypothetical protein
VPPELVAPPRLGLASPQAGAAVHADHNMPWYRGAAGVTRPPAGAPPPPGSRMKRDERETEQSNGVEWLWERGEADISISKHGPPLFTEPAWSFFENLAQPDSRTCPHPLCPHPVPGHVPPKPTCNAIRIPTPQPVFALRAPANACFGSHLGRAWDHLPRVRITPTRADAH